MHSYVLLCLRVFPLTYILWNLFFHGAVISLFRIAVSLPLPPAIICYASLQRWALQAATSTCFFHLLLPVFSCRRLASSSTRLNWNCINSNQTVLCKSAEGELVFPSNHVAISLILSDWIEMEFCSSHQQNSSKRNGMKSDDDDDITLLLRSSLPDHKLFFHKLSKQLEKHIWIIAWYFVTVNDWSGMKEERSGGRGEGANENKLTRVGIGSIWNAF